jgi:hypothetical protein
MKQCRLSKPQLGPSCHRVLVGHRGYRHSARGQHDRGGRWCWSRTARVHQERSRSSCRGRRCRGRPGSRSRGGCWSSRRGRPGRGKARFFGLLLILLWRPAA